MNTRIKFNNTVFLHHPVRNIFTVTVMVLTMLALSGCIGVCSDCGRSIRNADPVYMSYDELSRSVRVGDPLPLTELERVYIYNSTVFLNNKNRGIHVINNSDPSNPINVAFITIPGNTEISIRGSALYADSYVDLVTLDISNPDAISEIDREAKIFPYNAYQNIPDNVYFGHNGVDESRGVVVSYEYR